MESLQTQGKIVHMALQVDDVDVAATFYKAAFGLRELARLQVKNLTAVHLFDGTIYMSVVQYHSNETAESRALPRKPGIHHFGVEVEHPDRMFEELVAKGGCRRISPEGELPIKFFAPDGVLVEIAQPDYFKDRFLRPPEAMQQAA